MHCPTQLIVDPGAFVTTHDSGLSANVPIWLKGTACMGSETKLVDCPSGASHSSGAISFCSHVEDVKVTCPLVEIDPFPEQDSLRLVGSVIDNDTATITGGVQIFNIVAWGTICGDNFDNVDASVACGQLGYGTVGEFLTVSWALVCLD